MVKCVPEEEYGMMETLEDKVKNITTTTFSLSEQARGKKRKRNKKEKIYNWTRRLSMGSMREAAEYIVCGSNCVSDCNCVADCVLCVTGTIVRDRKCCDSNMAVRKGLGLNGMLGEEMDVDMDTKGATMVDQDDQDTTATAVNSGKDLDEFGVDCESFVATKKGPKHASKRDVWLGVWLRGRGKMVHLAEVVLRKLNLNLYQ